MNPNYPPNHSSVEEFAASSILKSAPNPFKKKVLLFGSGVIKLLKVNTSHLRVPTYHGFDFLKIKNILTYKGFRMDLLEIQKYPISRLEMEAAWVKHLVLKYRTWEVSKRQANRGSAEKLEVWMRRMLSEAIQQRFGRPRHDNVEEWWIELAKKYPGLNIDAIPEHLDALSDNMAALAIEVDIPDITEIDPFSQIKASKMEMNTEGGAEDDAEMDEEACMHHGSGLETPNMISDEDYDMDF